MSVAPPSNQRQVTLRDGRVVVLRPATPDDAQQVLDYFRRSLPHDSAYGPLKVEEFDYTLEQEREILAENPRALFICAFGGEHFDEMVGHVFARGSKRMRLRHSIEMGIGSLQAYHDTGIGRAMLGMLLEWADKNALIEQVTLRVYADNARASALYRKLGFVETGRMPRAVKYEDGTYRDDIYMLRDCMEVRDAAS